MTKVVVTMSVPNAFGKPVAGLTFLVVTESGDRVSIVTDNAGVASTWLPPASYRFVTPDPVEWQGKAYTWDMVVPVKAGSAMLKLSQENASKVVAVSSEPVPTSAAAESRLPLENQRVAAIAPGQIPFQYKDGTTATVLSVLLTGAGQMYSGEVGKGVAMLLSGVGVVVVGYAASGCNAYGCNDVGPLAAGYVGALGIWIYSMVDAHSAAARHNALAPRTAMKSRVSPIIGTGSKGTTRLGFNLRY
jgi:TM2 domain-containing membrane protein YozV